MFDWLDIPVDSVAVSYLKNTVLIVTKDSDSYCLIAQNLHRILPIGTPFILKGNRCTWRGIAGHTPQGKVRII